MDKNYWRVGETEGALGESLTAQGKFADAEPFLRQSHDTLKRLQRPDSARISQAELRLKQLIKLWRKPAE